MCAHAHIFACVFEPHTVDAYYIHPPSIYSIIHISFNSILQQKCTQNFPSTGHKIHMRFFPAHNFILVSTFTLLKFTRSLHVTRDNHYNYCLLWTLNTDITTKGKFIHTNHYMLAMPEKEVLNAPDPWYYTSVVHLTWSAISEQSYSFTDIHTQICSLSYAVFTQNVQKMKLKWPNTQTA